MESPSLLTALASFLCRFFGHICKTHHGFTNSGRVVKSEQKNKNQETGATKQTTTTTITTTTTTTMKNNQPNKPQNKIITTTKNKCKHALNNM